MRAVFDHVDPITTLATDPTASDLCGPDYLARHKPIDSSLGNLRCLFRHDGFYPSN
jgi:hypothetical protein